MKQINKVELTKLETKVKSVFIPMLILLCIFLMFKSCGAEARLAEVETMNKALGDTLVTWKDKEGNFKAKITLLESSQTESFTKLKSADSTIVELQSLVIKYKKQLAHKGSATIIHTDAEINLQEPTIVYRDSTKPYDPTYKSNFEIMGTGKYEKTKWVWGVVTATKDSTQVGMRFHEEIDVVIGQEKTGFLGMGKPKAFAEVTLHNPFNKVTTLRSYSTTPLPPKKFGIGPVCAYGVGPGFVPGVFVGIGVNYSILRL